MPNGNTFKDGSLLQTENGEIDVIYGGARFPVPSMDTFYEMGFNSANVQQIPDRVLRALPMSPEDGTLLRLPDGEIDVVYGGARFPVPSMDVFDAMGYQSTQVHQLWAGALDPIPTMPQDGTLLRLPDGEIDVVISGKRYGIPSMDVFDAMGYKSTDVRQVWAGALDRIPQGKLKPLDFRMQPSQQSNWCWAAVAASVSKFYDPRGAFQQCELANFLLGRHDCCENPSICNHGMSLTDALKHTGNFRRSSLVVTFAELYAEIFAGRPICVGIQYPDGARHYVVIFGCQDDERIWIADPAREGKVLAFHNFPTKYPKDGSLGAWNEIIFTK